MPISVGRVLAVLAGLLVMLLAAAEVRAQSCTLNGGNAYTSGTSWATILAAINGASDSAVACLERGNSWSSVSGTVAAITGAHATGSGKVIVCAATSTVCSSSGAARPAITFTNSNGFSFTGNVGGFEFRDLSITGCGNCGSSNRVALNFGGGATAPHDIHFVGSEGVLLTNWALFTQGTDGNSGNPAPNHIELGTCAKPIEWTVGADQSAGVHGGTYGALSDTSIRIYAHDINFGGGNSHFMDWGKQGSYLSADASINMTIECSFVDFSDVVVGSGLLKFASNQTLVIRSSTFLNFNTDLINLSSHGPDGNTYGVDGADIYGNIADTNGASGVFVANRVGSNVRVYNNLARLNRAGSGGNDGSFVYNACSGGGTNTADNDVANVSIFNNTVFMRGNTTSSGWADVHDNNGGCAAGIPRPANVSVVNNVFLDMDNDNPAGWALDSAPCSMYGTAGVNVHHNFEYSPNHAPTAMTNEFSTCTSTDSFILSGSSFIATGDGWSQLPGFSGDGSTWAGTLTTDLALASTSSRVYGKGSALDCPTTDFAGAVRPTPCSLGAFDIPSTIPPKGRGSGVGRFTISALERAIDFIAWAPRDRRQTLSSAH